jgi:Skp family chaperone for outer membrane proteins
MFIRVWLGLLLAAALMVVSGPASLAQPAPVVAVVDTSRFYDPESPMRVTELSNAASQVAREFQVTEAALRQLTDRMNALGQEIKAGEASGADPAAQKLKVESYNRLLEEFQRKQSEAEVNYARRLQDVVGPIEQRVFPALQTYLTAKGFTDLVDLATGTPAPPGSVDETAAFSDWYNSQPKG